MHVFGSRVASKSSRRTTMRSGTRAGGGTGGARDFCRRGLGRAEEGGKTKMKYARFPKRAGLRGP